MSTKVLANTIILGTTKFWPGTSLDTVSEAATIAALQGMGGKLYDSTDPGVSEAAAQCIAIRGRGGNEEACEAAMNAAIDEKQQEAIAGSSTVDDTTAVNQPDTTGVAVDQRYLAHIATFPGATLPAAGVPVHAQDPGGAPLNLVAGFSNPVPRRTLAITRGALGPPSVVYTVHQVYADGSNADVPVPVGPGATAVMTEAGEVTSITSDLDPGDTTDFETGDGFNVGSLFTGAIALAVDSVEEAAVYSNGVSGTVTPTTPPDGTKTFGVRMFTGHDHGVTDGGHTHVQDPHDHTLS